MNDSLDQIRSRLSIEDVVARYVTMKKSGRNFKALCPFHQEKTPSFIISPDKGLAYCFGCRKGGDIFAFTQEIEQVDFRGALEMLAEKAGVTLTKQAVSPESKQEKERALKALEAAHVFFQQCLKANKSMMDYLLERGYDAQTVAKLELGYSPDSFHLLCEALHKQGFSAKDLLDSGLASQKEVGDTAIYDRFRNRIMFPIHDAQGTLVAFGGRIMSADTEAAKYLNSPETKYYHKGSVLYLLHKAKQAIREKDRAIVVEGYFDALMAHQKGYTETVSSLGTALTEEQVKTVGRFSKRLIFAFDPDRAGLEAASRSIEIAQRLGYDAHVLRIAEGIDPDEAMLRGVWDEAVKKSVPAMDYEFQQAFAKADSRTLEGKKKIMSHLFLIIRRLPGSVDQEFYLQKLSDELHLSLHSLMKDYQHLSPRKISAQHKKEGPEIKTVHFSREEYLLGILFNMPDHFEMVSKELSQDIRSQSPHQNLYKRFLPGYNPSAPSPEDQFTTILSLFAHEKYQAFSPEELKAEVLTLCRAIRREAQKKNLQGLAVQISQAEKSGTLHRDDSLLKEYQRLTTSSFYEETA